MFPFDLTVDALSAAQRGLGLRHQAIAQNLANADTPGYRRVDVQFEGALAAALAGDRAAAELPDPRLDATRPQAPTPAADTTFALDTVTQDGTVMRHDGGNVDPDTEMAEMAANQLAYQTVTSLLGKKFSQLGYVINGR
ncbi:MAG: flagellar basal body rod protein FlgB [Actinomycetota bacterium]